MTAPEWTPEERRAVMFADDPVAAAAEIGRTWEAARYQLRTALGTSRVPGLTLRQAAELTGHGVDSLRTALRACNIRPRTTPAGRQYRLTEAQVWRMDAWLSARPSAKALAVEFGVSEDHVIRVERELGISRGRRRGKVRRWYTAAEARRVRRALEAERC